VYVGGQLTNRVYQLWASNLTKKSQSAVFGGSIQSLWLDPNGSFLYVGLSSAVSRIYKVRVSDWSSTFVSTGVGTRTYGLAGDANWLYAVCSNVSTNTVREYFKGNLTRHVQSPNYGGELHACVLGVAEVWVNTVPVISLPMPDDGSIGVKLYPKLSVKVTDPDVNQTLVTCFWENRTIPGVWHKVQQNTSSGISSQTVFVSNASFVNLKKTRYWWKVTVSDGTRNVSAVFSFVSENHPPFTLPNDPAYETSIRVHSGYLFKDQVVHSDLVYFPNGWGFVNGSHYKYWLCVEGYYMSQDDYEQPCILVSNNMSNNSWVEPARNFYGTNPITKYVYSGRGHYCDGDLVYNDETDQLWLYIANGTGTGAPDFIEIYTTADGVNWSFHDKFTVFGPNNFMSISVIKDGSTWYCWGRNGSGTPHLEYHTSSDGIHWNAGYNCGSGMQSAPGSYVWHINVNKYNGQYWGFLVESPLRDQLGPPLFGGFGELDWLGGDYAKLYFINSTDGGNWSGYDAPLLNWGLGGSWDNHNIYRSDFIVQDGYLKSIYTAANGFYPFNWHAGYTFKVPVGGTGHSSNVID
jgi:hypothetical protein